MTSKKRKPQETENRQARRGKAKPAPIGRLVAKINPVNKHRLHRHTKPVGAEIVEY